MSNKVIPETWLRCMSKEDRRAIGQMSAQEALEAFTARNERQLSTQIVNLLRLKGIEVCVNRTDKKSSATIGWPDLTFSVNREIDNEVCPCAWELKFENGKLSPEQEKMHIRLQSPPNYWRVRVITSVQQALKELRSMGIE